MTVVLTIIGLFVGILVGILIGMTGACIQCGKNHREVSLQQSEKSMLEYWIQRNRDEKRNMFLFFLNNDYYNIAVYGARGRYYDCFMQDTALKCFRNIYLADRCAQQLSKETGEKVYTKEELRSLNLDAIVITSDLHYEEIKKELDVLQIGVDIFSYRDLVYNLRKEKLE